MLAKGVEDKTCTLEYPTVLPTTPLFFQLLVASPLGDFLHRGRTGINKCQRCGVVGCGLTGLDNKSSEF